MRRYNKRQRKWSKPQGKKMIGIMRTTPTNLAKENWLDLLQHIKKKKVGGGALQQKNFKI